MKVAEENVKTNEFYYPRHHGHGYFGALILVIVGIIFLLNNFNILPEDFWIVLWKFWPLLLILWGLHMLLGKGKISSLITTLIGLALFLLIIGAYLASVNPEFELQISHQIPWLHLENLQFLISH